MVTIAEAREIFEKPLSDRELQVVREMEKANACGRAYVELMGKKTAAMYYKRIDCERWYCPKCGGNNGKLHKKRKRAVINHFGGIEELKSSNIGQFVLTVPSNIRWYFANRGNLNALFRMAKRTIEKYFGKERLTIYYLHLFGDQSSELKPHINVHMKWKENELGFLSREKLDKIRETWRKSLEGYVREWIPVVDIQYGYRKGIRKILHSIKYMSRPTDRNLLYNIKLDERINYFLLYEMKGFRYIRTYGGENIMREEGNFLEEIKEMSGKAGEPLMYMRTISAGEFKTKFIPEVDLEKIDDGFYRERTKPKKNK